jgi:predicted nucleic acid-binding Zn ribbon protein
MSILNKVGSIVEKMLKKHNLWQGYQQFMAVESWSSVVGLPLSSVTRSESISRGILRVTVKDSVWAYHLSLLKPKLIEQLNNHIGNKVVKDIFFVIENIDKT